MASTFPGRRPGGGLGMSSPLKSKAGLGSTDMVSDDNFYSNLAAEIDEESDVSEADVSKMLADMDDMDDALFGSSLKSRPSSAAPMQPAQKDNVDKSPSKSKPGLGETFTLDKTLEEELSRALETSSKLEESPPVSPRRGNKPKTSLKKFDFGEFDEDDPLAGLLSDEDDNGVTKKPPKKKPLKRSKAEEPQKSDPKPEPTPELDPAPVSKNVDLAEDDKPSRTRKPESVEKGDQFVKLDASPSKKPKGKTIDFDDDDDDSDILGSLGLEKSVKGTVAKSEGSASTKPSRSRGKGEAEADFGDESDLLGSLGLEASPRERRRSRPEDNREVEQARSKVNELFGASSTSKMLDKPPAGKQRHSQLDKILQKKDSAPKANVKEEKEENFSFGDYTPSSVTARPESAPPSRRSVRFSDEDDLLGAGSDRSRSRAGMSPYLEEPAQRPRSAAAGMVGSRRSGKNSKPGVAAEDNWLELATGTDGAKPDEKSDTGKQKASATDKNLRVESSPQHRPPLTTSESSTKHETRASPEKVKKEPPARVPSAADYLGLSDTDIDLDSLVQPKALTPRDETPMDSTLDNPFSAPTKRDTISPFPWDGSSGRARPDRLPATNTPQPTGPKKEPQWRQQMRQKQQQQRQDGTDMQQLNSSGTWAGMPEKHAAMPSTGARQQPSQPLALATQPSSLPRYTPTPTQQPQPALPANTAWQEQLEQSQRELDEALKKQQAQWASQQQALQQQLQQQQQQQAMQQQQQAMQQQLQMQEALLKAQAAPSPATLHAPGASPLTIPGLTSFGLEGKIHQLEAEKRRLEAELLVAQQAQHQQKTAMENAHKDYTQLLEESAGRRETRLRQEHAAALQQYEQRLKQLQEDQAAQQQQQQQRVQQLNAEHSGQLQQLQQTHRLAMDAVQQQHEQQLQQVQLAVQREMEALRSAQTHSKSLQAVVDQVQSASKELGSLQSQVQGQHHSQLEQRSVELKEKDQQLQVMEKRLSDKQDEMNQERARLEALVSRLEAHIRQQNSQLDEERFRLRQEQSKLSSLQRAVEEERKLAGEQLASQQASLQRAKDAILGDQKTIMAQCLEERKALAAERAQVAATRRQLEASLQEQANKAMQVGAEQEGKLESLAAERSQLTAQGASLQQQQQALQQEKLQLGQRRQELDGEQRRLQQLAETLRQRSQQIQEAVAEGVQAREEGQSALQAAKTIEADQATREMNLQAQLQTLRATQRQIAQERLDLAREQRNLERLKGSLRCQMCGGPAAPPKSPAWSTNNNVLLNTPHLSRSMQLGSDDSHYPEREMAPSRALTTKDVDALLSQAELGHSLRMWKVEAEKDKEFLEEESIFLETLKTPLPAGYVQKA